MRESGQPCAAIAYPHALDAKWNQLLPPLEMDPRTSTTNPRATGVVWPLNSWIRYLCKQQEVNRTLPLIFIVKGDGYPEAGNTCTKITISLLNMGRPCHSPTGFWALWLANFFNLCCQHYHWTDWPKTTLERVFTIHFGQQHAWYIGYELWAPPPQENTLPTYACRS